MGQYTSWDLLCGRYEDAAKRGDAPAVENYFIMGAEAEVDAAAAVRYTLPFSPAPAFLIDLATDLAYWKMYLTRKGSDALRKSIDARLEALRTGNAKLTSSGSSLDRSNFAACDNAYSSAFGPDDPVNWRPDRDALQDAKETRNG